MYSALFTNFSANTTHKLYQENIPVGCVAPASVAIIRCQYHVVSIPGHTHLTDMLMSTLSGIPIPFRKPRYIHSGIPILQKGPGTRHTHPHQLKAHGTRHTHSSLWTV